MNKFLISDSFLPPLHSTKRYLLLYGSAGSGKSEFAARKLIIRAYSDNVSHRFLIVRKYANTLKDSVIEIMKSALNSAGLKYKEKVSDRKLILSINGIVSEFIFRGLDDPEKIKSIKGITGIWIEEATEITYFDFQQLDLRLREPIKTYHQIIMTFNPVLPQGQWIKEMFFDESYDNELVDIFHYTLLDNPIKEVRARYKRILENIKDDTYRTIYKEGKWASADETIFKNNFYVIDELPKNYDEVIYGLDFGYVNPTALVMIGIKEDNLYLKELLYESGLTSTEIAKKVSKLIHSGDAIIYADSAEPDKIAELENLGLLVYPFKKNVKEAIGNLLKYNIYTTNESPNIIKEFRSYKWQKINGQVIEKPVKYMDHTVDAVKDAVYTHIIEANGISIIEF